MGNYNMVDDFYMVRLSNSEIILEVQQLTTIWKNWKKYQTMEMGFKMKGGQRAVLRGIAQDPPNIATLKQMVSRDGQKHIELSQNTQ